MKLPYTVFSADEITLSREIEVDGEVMTAQSPGLSVQLVPNFPGAQGTIVFNLTTKQLADLTGDHPFIVGSTVMVEFKAEE